MRLPTNSMREERTLACLPTACATWLVLALSACTSTIRRADGPLFGALADAACSALLQEHVRIDPALEFQVAFVGIQNKSAEELAEHRESVYDRISTTLTNSHRFRMVSRDQVEAALREIGARGPEDLFLEAKRSRFLSVLGVTGLAPEFLLFAKVTSESTGSGTARARVYQLTLELAESKSGEIVIRKSERRSPSESD